MCALHFSNRRNIAVVRILPRRKTGAEKGSIFVSRVAKLHNFGSKIENQAFFGLTLRPDLQFFTRRYRMILPLVKKYSYWLENQCIQTDEEKL